MIFLIIGTQKFQFNRLLKQVDGLVKNGLIDAPVIAQTGNSDYTPRHYSYSRFYDKNEFEKYVEEAEMIITHSGVGAIMTAVKRKKKIVVVPRLRKYGEHVDDHQREIARAFEKKGYVVRCEENDALDEIIIKCRDFVPPGYLEHSNEIVKIINDFLNGEKLQ